MSLGTPSGIGSGTAPGNDPGPSPGPSGRLPGLRIVLPALVLLALCPALIPGLIAARQAAADQRAAAMTRLADVTAMLARGLDHEVAGVIVALDAFAAAPGSPADPATLARVEAQARRLAGRLGLPIRFVARDGAAPPRPLVGASSVLSPGREAVEAVFADGRPAVGDPMAGPAAERDVLVAVPVRDAEGQVALVATAAVGMARLQALLAAPDAGLGLDAVALLTDGRGRVAARSDGPGSDAEALPRQPLHPGGASAPVRAVDRAGVERVFAVAGIAAMPGWTLVVARPAAALDAIGRQPLLGWAVGGVLALLSGGLLAAGLAWGMRRPLRDLLVQVRTLTAIADPARAAASPATAGAADARRRGPRIAELEALRHAVAEAAAAAGNRPEAAAARQPARAAADGAAPLPERGEAQAAEDQRAALRRREEAQAALLQAQTLQALGELAGSVAHDFNGALATIVGSYRLIERRIGDPALLQTIRDGDRAAEHAATLMRRLVAFARREELRPAPLELPAVLAEVREMIGYTVGRRLSVAVELPSGLWPVLADPHRLEMALLDLAADARDVLPPGGALLITARNLPPEQPRPAGVPPGGAGSAGLRPGDRVAITVRHAGDAPPPGAIPGGRDGHGLGLAMVRRFVEQSGGACVVDRRPGAGTTVEILLPRAHPQEDAVMPVEAEALDPRLHGGAAILLVDAEEPARARLAALLRDLGYTVAEAGDAEAAESLAHWLGKLDLLITAMELPATDGAALATRLRLDRPAMPALFLTAFEPGPVLAGEAVLRRPVGAAELAGTMLELLQRRRSLRAPPPGMRLLRRLQTPSLRAAYLSWHAARLAGEALPRLANLDLGRLELAEHCVLVAVDRPDVEPGTGEAADPGFRFVSVGRALTDRLGHGLDGTPVEGAGEWVEIPGSLQATYRRCARTRAPVFESANFDFGDGPPLRFERVTLPLSEDGQALTHLVGVVLFHEDAMPGRIQAVPAG